MSDNLKKEEKIGIAIIAIVILLIVGVGSVIISKNINVRTSFYNSIKNTKESAINKKVEITLAAQTGISNIKKQIANAFSEKGETIKVSISFKPNEYQLSEEDMRGLTKVAEFSRKYPKAKIVITGHTDKTGTKENNINLSIKRTTTVEAYLKSQGALNFEGIGYGSSALSERQVEVVVTNR